MSRQETQRALMTPGEVMQLSPADEVLMVSGTPPILAKKLRYFKDRNFTVRIPAPLVCPGKSGPGFELALAPTEELRNGPETIQGRRDHCAFA